LKDIYTFIPLAAHSKIQEYVENNNFSVKITRQRATKHGDFRKLTNGEFLITINENLNPHQFLLTLVHEIAHYITYKRFGIVKPHGIEWKNTFKELMLPFVNPETYPNTILPYLAKYLLNAKASTDSDVNLSLALKQERLHSDKNYIFELEIGRKFQLKKRTFAILEKKRTRYICIDLTSQKKYLINQNAEVTPLQL
jgi:hypothetical protein